MKVLEKEGYARGSQRTIFQIVKRVFDAAKVDWPMGKRAAPKVQPSDVVKPALSVDDARLMINAAKEGKLAGDEAAFLALSTVLGLRCQELASIRDEDIDCKKRQIYVNTCKGGVQRYQLIPEEIIPYLEGHDFDKINTVNSLQPMFHRIEAKAGVVHKDGATWHSPRRQIDTELVQWNYVKTKIFMRWKLAGDMALAYVTLDPLKVDREVFEQAPHPFLPLWR